MKGRKAMNYVSGVFKRFAALAMAVMMLAG